jgi:hypothetical protein
MTIAERVIRDRIQTSEREVGTLFTEAKKKMAHLERLLSHGQGVMLQDDVPISELTAMLRKFESIGACKEILRSTKAIRERRRSNKPSPKKRRGGVESQPPSSVLPT